MFDIGFWELVLIAVIGIVVVGPDKLPEVVRSIMVMVRKVQRMFSDVRGDIERELHLDEVRKSVEAEELQEHIRKLNQSVLNADTQVRSEGKKLLQEIDAEVKAVEKSLQDMAQQTNVADMQAAEAQRDTGIETITSQAASSAAAPEKMAEKITEHTAPAAFEAGQENSAANISSTASATHHHS